MSHAQYQYEVMDELRLLEVDEDFCRHVNEIIDLLLAKEKENDVIQ